MVITVGWADHTRPASEGARSPCYLPLSDAKYATLTSLSLLLERAVAKDAVRRVQRATYPGRDHDESRATLRCNVDGMALAWMLREASESIHACLDLFPIFAVDPPETRPRCL
jgi:hypothetical protein